MAAVPLPVLADNPARQIFRNKSYAHLDAKRKPGPLEDKIKDPLWVVRHGFLPFIHIVLKTKRRVGKRKPPEYKDRHIYYASHMDRYIYQWYAHLTSVSYERYIERNGFSEAAIAYRSLGGRTNIHFAKEAFDFIRTRQDCFVLVSDFSKYFDSLDHSLLKAKLKKVLGVTELSEDHYRVFKSITKFHYFDLKDIATATETPEKLLRDKKKKPAQLLSLPAMRQLKSTCLKSNPNRREGVVVGIPQGSPISAVYANVYLIDFDQQLTEFVRSVGGFYRRYSDDVICIVPTSHANELRTLYEDLLSEARVTLSKDKTKEYRILNGCPYVIVDPFIDSIEAGPPGKIEYLGFAYDGKCIRLRERTTNRYYYKLNSRLFLLQHLANEKDRLVGRRKLYARFSHLGEANRRYLEEMRPSSRPVSVKKRNFFTYIRNAEETFSQKEIRHQVRGHWRRICRFIRNIKIEGPN